MELVRTPPGVTAIATVQLQVINYNKKHIGNRPITFNVDELDIKKFANLNFHQILLFAIILIR